MNGELTLNRKDLISMILTTILIFFLTTPRTIVKAVSQLELPENEDIAIHATYNVTLLVSDWDGEYFLGGLNISIYDSNNNMVLSGISNDTGCLSVKLEKGFYIAVAKANYVIVGYQELYVDESKTVILRVRAYTLGVTCIDQKENGVQGAVVLLYSSARNFNETSINGKWYFISLAKTNRDGAAFFHGVWNGTYKIVVESGRIIGEKILEVNKSRCVTIKCNRTSLKINVVTSTERPLSNASVLLQDSAGHVFLRDYTDEKGVVQFNSIYVDNYTVFIDWSGVEVFSGTINTGFSKSLKIKASVFEVSLRITGPFGEPLPYSKVVLSKRISGRYIIDLRESEADRNGFITFLLPPGTYEISCTSGIYLGKISVNLFDNYSGIVQCNLHPNVWILLFLISLPLSLLSLLLERSKLRRPLEYRRYQNMLSKLESMYSNGLVEYKIYRKLKEEYEAKLMELGGRKRR
jgi:hypothetical protein